MILTSGKELAIQQDDLLLLVARILVITCPKVNFLLLRCVCIFRKKLITFIAAKKRHGYQLHWPSFYLVNRRPKFDLFKWEFVLHSKRKRHNSWLSYQQLLAASGSSLRSSTLITEVNVSVGAEAENKRLDSVIWHFRPNGFNFISGGRDLQISNWMLHLRGPPWQSKVSSFNSEIRHSVTIRRLTLRMDWWPQRQCIIWFKEALPHQAWQQAASGLNYLVIFRRIDQRTGVTAGSNWSMKLPQEGSGFIWPCNSPKSHRWDFGSKFTTWTTLFLWS